jgi:hypothetical protein
VSDIKPLNWTTETRTTVVCVPSFLSTLRRPQLMLSCDVRLRSADCSVQWWLVTGHAQWTGMASSTAYSTSTPQKPTLFDGRYLQNRKTLDIGVLGYIGVVWHKEHPPEVWSVPPDTPCIYDISRLRVKCFVWPLTFLKFEARQLAWQAVRQGKWIEWSSII